MSLTIDARGFPCPKPVIMAEEALMDIQEGFVEIMVDNEASASNVSRFAKKLGLHVERKSVDNYWILKIVKGFQCNTDTDQTQEDDRVKSEKELFLIVATHAFGKDEELGKVLMKGTFETMKVTGEVPNTIFFLNTGVHITTSQSEILNVLQELEDMGTEIFTCGTCLKHYGLEDSLKVGYRGTTNHIVEGMKEFKKTVWIG